MRRRAALLVLALAAGSFAVDTLAHPLAPALLKIRQLDSERFEVLWRQTPGLAGGPRGSGQLLPVLPAACRPEEEPAKSRDGGDLVTRWVVVCSGGLAGARIVVEGLDQGKGDVLVFVQLLGGRQARGVITAGRPEWTLPRRQTLAQVAAGYLSLGLGHILGGFDHLLFVLGLVLLVASWRKLLWTVSGFTLGHSVTLALAALGLVRVPSRPVEAAIAFSIFWLAVEIRREGTSLLRRHPAAMASAFGLLHGLGFAGALAEVGLPQGEIPLALASFNVGIELGQVLFVLAALAAGAFLRALPFSLPRWAPALPVYLIGTLGAFWMLQRALGLG
jgi:HupE / UreJ protein